MGNIGPDLNELTTLVPPPDVGSEVGIFGKIKRGFKRAGRGIKRGARRVGRIRKFVPRGVRRGFGRAGRFAGRGVRRGFRGVKRGARFAGKVYTKPIRLAAKAGKWAMLKAAKLAATPITRMFRKLALRRARYLSYQNRKSLTPNRSEKNQAVAWAIQAMRRKGPIGRFGVKILQFTKTAKLSGPLVADLVPEWEEARMIYGEREQLEPVSEVGLTGAEIAAAAAAIVSAISAIMRSLNKEGQAPADPRVFDVPEEMEAEEEYGEADEWGDAVDAANEDAYTEGWSTMGGLLPHDEAFIIALKQWHLTEHRINDAKRTKKAKAVKALIKRVGPVKAKKVVAAVKRHKQLQGVKKLGPVAVPPVSKLTATR